MADPNQKDDDLEEFAATVAIDTNQLDMSPPAESDDQAEAESKDQAESEELDDMEATMPMSADAAQAFLEDMEAEKEKAAKDLTPDATLPDDQDMAFANTLAADNDVVDQAKKMLAESGKQPVVNRSTVVESKENIEAVLSQAQQKVQDQSRPAGRGGVAPTVAERAIPSTQQSPNVSGQTPVAAGPQGPGPQRQGPQNPGHQPPQGPGMQPGRATSQANLSPQGPIGAPGPQPTKPASGTSRGLIIAIGIVVILLAGAIAFVVTVALG